MKRTNVKDFIQLGINSLDADIVYGTGRISEFNKERMNSYPYIWMEPLTRTVELTTGAPLNNWSVLLYIVDKDQADSQDEQYEPIVDSMDQVAAELIQKYNQIISGYKLVTISNIEVEPYILKLADVLTGVRLSFTLTSPDTQNWC